MSGMLSVGVKHGCGVFCAAVKGTLGHTCSSQCSKCEDAQGESNLLFVVV